MYLQELIEVAIGLMLVFVVVSLSAAQVQELLAGWLRWRADNLEDAIRTMLADPAAAPGWQRTLARLPIFQSVWRAPAVSGLVERLYAHPLIKSLGREGKPPSYIPAQNFALALFDIVTTAGTDASVVQHHLYRLRAAIHNFPKLSQAERAQITQAIDGMIARTEQAISRIRSSSSGEIPSVDVTLSQIFGDGADNVLTTLSVTYPQVTQVLRDMTAAIEHDIEAIRALGPQALPHQGSTLADIRAGATALIVLQPELQWALDNLINHVEEYLSEKDTALGVARKNVETWFNDTMDRCTGWYKRNVKWVLLLIGLGLAGILNIDSINIATVLWREPTVRQALVVQAQNYHLPASDEAPAAAGQIIPDLSAKLSADLHIPMGWKVAPRVVPPDQRCALVAVASGQAWGMPVGADCLAFTNMPGDLSGIMSKLAGLLITAAAAVLGAPFWFDLLGKFINVRAAGVKPQTDTTQTA